MPEIRFQIQWPDGSEETCYSPSLVVKDYFSPGEAYSLTEFVARSRTALTIASDRVEAKYGFPCGRALGQLQHIEQRAIQYTTLNDPQVQFVNFLGRALNKHSGMKDGAKAGHRHVPSPSGVTGGR